MSQDPFTGVNPFKDNPYEAPQADLGGVRDYEAPPDLAARGTRLLGLTIDNLVYGLAAIPGVIVMLPAMDDPGMIDESLTATGLMMVGVLIAAAVQAYLISTTGQSIGKKLLNMKIVRTDLSPAGFMNGVFLRSWVFTLLTSVVPGIGPLIGLADGLAIFGEECRTLHDRLADTIVIEV